MHVGGGARAAALRVRGPHPQSPAFSQHAADGLRTNLNPHLGHLPARLVPPGTLPGPHRPSMGTTVVLAPLVLPAECESGTRCGPLPGKLAPQPGSMATPCPSWVPGAAAPRFAASPVGR